MKNISVMIVAGILVLTAAFLSGCLKSSEDEDDGGDEIKKGSSWTYKITDSNYGPGTMNVKVTKDSMTFEGTEVIAVEADFTYEAFTNEDSGYIYDEWGGTSETYFRKADFEVMYMKYDWTTVAKWEPTGNWSTSRWVGEVTYTTTGNIPDPLSAGSNYTLEIASSDHSDVYSNDVLVPEMSGWTNNTKSTVYRILGEKEVTVPAGTYTCWEIKVEGEFDGEYTMRYFSKDLGIDVKFVDYYDDEIMVTHELQSHTS